MACKSSVWLKGIGLTGLALSISQAVYAQQGDTQSEGQAKVAGDMDMISVTASRQTEQVLDIPATVNVITRHQMDENVVNTVEDLVRYQPGVTVDRQTSGTDPFGNFGSFTIRGVGGNRVQIQVDGSRVIEQGADGNRSFVDLSTMKAVEIVRGPGSVLWGSDALGGIVAYRTLDPDDLLDGGNKSIGGKIEAGYDSLNDGFTESGMVAMQFSPSLQGLLAVTRRDYTETELRNAKADGGLWDCSRVGIGCDKLNPMQASINNILAKLVWRPAAGHEVRLTGEFFESDSDVLQLYDKNISTRAGTITTINDGDYWRNQTQKRQRVALAHTWDVDAPALDRLSWQLSYSPQKRAVQSTRNQTRVAGSGARSQLVTYDKLDYEEDFWQADVQLTSSFNWGSSSHVLTYGFQGDITDTDYWRQSVVKNLTAGTSTTTLAGGFNFANAKTTRADIYLQDEMKFFDERLTVTPGLRWANYTIDPRPDSNYKVAVGKEPRKLDSSRVLPQVGGLYRFTDVYSGYLRYAEGFKMPTAQQLYTSLPSATFDLIPNPNLEPEKVKSYELGVRGQYEDAWFSFGGFYADYDNFIKSMQLVPGTTKDYTYLNIAEVKLWGLEASGEWKFHPNWTLHAAANYQFGKQRNRAGDEYIPFDGASPLSGTLGVKWSQPAWRLDAELVGTFSKGISRTESPDDFQPGGYGVFDAYLNWKLNKTFTVTAGVLNIFDKRYFTNYAATFERVPASAATDRTNPLELQTAPGRSFKVNLVANF